MTDKLRRTHPLNITFADGEAPSAAKLTAIATQARVGARVLENAIGDLWNQSGDTLLNSWPLQIPNLARVIGQVKELSPALYPPVNSFTYVDNVGLRYQYQNSGYLQFKPATLASVSIVSSGGIWTTRKDTAGELASAGDYWIDLATGRWATYAPIDVTNVISYAVDPSAWALTTSTLPSIIPDTRQPTFTGCRVSSSGGKFYLHLPPRRPLTLTGWERPERYPPTTDISANEATTTTESKKLWQASTALALGVEHYRYQLPKEILDTISSLDVGTTLPTGYLYLWDQGKRTIVANVVFKTSSFGNWVLEISSDTEDFSTKISSTESQSAYNATSYSLVVVGSPLTRIMHSLQVLLQAGTHSNAGDFTPLLSHSSLTGMNPPMEDYTGHPGTYPLSTTWTPSNYAMDDHVYLLSRTGSHGVGSGLERDGSDNAMLGDLVIGSTSADTYSNNITADSNRLYWGGVGIGPHLYWSTNTSSLMLNSIPDSAYSLYIDNSNTYGFPAFESGGIFLNTFSSFRPAIYANSFSTFAIAASSSSNVALTVAGPGGATPSHGAFHIDPQLATPTGLNVVGDFYLTVAGVLKVCTVAGAPGTWVSVGAQV